MALPLQRLFDLPVPEQAVILARGPSLAKYDQTRFPTAAVFGVNDVGFHPDYRCDYAVFIDRQFAEMPKPCGIPIRDWTYRDSFDGVGYYWTVTRDRPDERKAFGRTGSAAILIPWMWGCRDIWIYGMDAFPDCNPGGSYIDGLVDPHPSYKTTVDLQKAMISAFGMDGKLHWAHMEGTNGTRN